MTAESTTPAITSAIRWADATDGRVYANLFARDVSVSLNDGGNQVYAQSCADLLNSLPPKVVNDFLAAAIRYCNGFLEEVGEPLREFGLPEDVLKLLEGGGLIVPATTDETRPVVHMELNCDWEDEHGLELIVRDDRLIYVGGYDGYAAFEENFYGNYAELA